MRYRLTLIMALVVSVFVPIPASATPIYLPLCSIDSFVTCIESVLVKGAGLPSWTEVPTFTTVVNRARPAYAEDYIADLGSIGYLPRSGYSSILRIHSVIDNYDSNRGFQIFVDSGDEIIPRRDTYGDYFRNLDPDTEVKLKINTLGDALAGYNFTIQAFGSTHNVEYISDHFELTLSAKVALRATSRDCDMSLFNCSGPANTVQDGILSFIINKWTHTMPNEYTFFDGMAVTENSYCCGGTGMPWVRNMVYFDGFTIILQSPHTLTDGVTPTPGYFSADIPASSLIASGTTQADVLSSGVVMTADYGGSKSDLLPTVEAISAGGIRITASDFHYSSPTIDTKFRGLSQTVTIGDKMKKKKKILLPLQSTQELVLTWRSSTPKVCKVLATYKTSKKKIGKKWVKTKRVTKWQLQGRTKGTCKLVGSNLGSEVFKPAVISKSILVN